MNKTRWIRTNHPIFVRLPEQQLAQLIRHLCGHGDKPEHLNNSLVRFHRLGPLAYQHGFSAFKTDFVQHALFAELREQELSATLNGLQAEGIDVALLKGISYVGTIYKDIAERSMGDMDLLVRAHAFANAKKTLRALGYRERPLRFEKSEYHHAVTMTKGKFVIDLHRRIYQPGRSALSMAEVWNRSIVASERDDGARRLCPSDEVLFHLLHMARSECMVSAIAYVDLPRLVKRACLSTTQILQMAKKNRVHRAVQHVLKLSDSMQVAPFHSKAFQRSFFLPSPQEVLSRAPLSRGRQIAVKLLFSEGIPELLALGVTYVAEHSTFLRPFRKT